MTHSNRKQPERKQTTTHFPLFFLGIAAIISGACAQTPRGPNAPQSSQLSPPPNPSTSTAPAPAPGSKPYATPLSALPAPPHEMVVRMLLNDDSAVPERPPIHPLRTVFNREAVIPPMCYTRTEGANNPCYVCHQSTIPGRPNAMDDGELQAAYSLSSFAETNHWSNLFVDRSDDVSKISDEEILDWVSSDNYTELRARLLDEDFQGYLPDLKNLQLGAEAFTSDGFAKDGSHWVAFNYKPMPSTFWPTNGATDDVMIRLPPPFRQTPDGTENREVYRANLAILEANIKELDTVSVRALDEAAVGSDLNGDGRLSIINRITKFDRYVGAATDQLKISHLYPLDTEFLHSVRYLGVSERGDIFTPPRMKELRYMKKRFFMSREALAEEYRQEGYNKDAGYLPGYVNRGPHGLDNEMGWVVLGFIENKRGQLRVNSFEENLYCMGCHTSVGSTIDNVFSFARKIDGAEGWGYLDLHGMPDAPNQGETEGEIATYLRRAGGGGEFRSNPEMEKRWFTDGKADPRKIAQARDVYELLAPSADRALLLNKAYRVIVSEQSFLYGRDPTVTPPVNVYAHIDNETTPSLPPEHVYEWDIRLDWSKAPTRPEREELSRLTSHGSVKQPQSTH